MPWKYLRITRRCTCVAPVLEEEEKCFAAVLPGAAAFFWEVSTRQIR